MQELRLVGIADDGEHLLLTGDGERYKLALNDELRTAVRRDRRVTAGGAAATRPDSPLRPRDVQGLIRGGVPLEEIADRAGWSLEKVQRYEGPIRAERDYVSERAQSVVLPSRTETVTLRERAAARLADRGVEAERVVWDSWKTDETHWSVVVRFPAGGRLREATWLFDPVAHSLRTVDDEARWLGGDELASASQEAPEAAAKSASTQRKRAASRPASVYDVEAEGGVADAQPAHLGAALGGEDLTASMRARQASRGRAQRGRPSGSRATSAPSSPSSTPGTSAPSTTSPTSAASPTNVPVETPSPEEAHVEVLDVGTVPPPAPSHPRPNLAAVDSADADDEPSTPVQVSDATSDDASLEAEEAPTGSKRRKSRRSRGSGERGPVRTAFSGDNKQDDESLFGELPGFGDDVAGDEDAETTSLEEHDAHRETGELTEQGVTTQDESLEHASDDAPASDDEDEKAAPEKPSSDAAPEVPQRASKSRAGRPSVPSWDDIMFGGRGPKN